MMRQSLEVRFASQTESSVGETCRAWTSNGIFRGESKHSRVLFLKGFFCWSSSLLT